MAKYVDVKVILKVQVRIDDEADVYEQLDEVDFFPTGTETCEIVDVEVRDYEVISSTEKE